MAVGEMISKEPTIVESETGEKPVIKVEPPQESFEAKKNIIHGKQLLWYGWLSVEVILLFRFLIKLFGANTDSSFYILIAFLSMPFRIIFDRLFTSGVPPVGNIVIEWSTLFAMFAYTLIVWVVSRFIKLKKPIDPEEAEIRVEKTIP